MFIKGLNITRSKDLFEKAFKRAKKIQISERDKRYKTKKTIIARTDVFSTIIISFLEKIIKGFPSLDKLPLFYQELIDIKIDINKLKKSLKLPSPKMDGLWNTSRNRLNISVS